MAFIESTVGILAFLSKVLSLLDRFFSEEKALREKFDEKDLRRFWSSCSALVVAMDCHVSAETRSSHLRHAEDGFLEYVHVDPERDFGPLTGATVLTVATAGLARIYETRGDNLLFRKYALLTFSRDPRRAREEIFPDFYQAELGEECQKRVDNWYRQELSELDRRDFIEEAKESSRGPSEGVYFQGTYFTYHSPPSPGYYPTPEELRDKAIKRIQDGIPEQTEKACREVVKQKLSFLLQSVAKR